MTQTIQTAGPERDCELGELLLSGDDLFHVSRLVTVGELAACFAHEVSNPLTIIRGHLRSLEEMISEGDPLRSHLNLRAHLKMMVRASSVIEDMSRRMLDFSRTRTSTKERCEVRDLLREATRFVSPYLQSLMIDVRIDVKPYGTAILVHRWQLVQAFVNLMQNAADAMAECSRRALTISVRNEGSNTAITFADTGTGISTANLNKLFNAFFTTKGERGTGLGLYITRRIIEEHQGTVACETSGTGTRFILNLPMEASTTS